MLKVGLVGVGRITGAHIHPWEAMDDVELVALCDVRKERLDRYPDKRHYFDFDEMLENEQLDIIDICLPTYLHADYAIKAMEKGINVISEKPISLKEEDVERVYATAHRMNVKFMTAQVLRFWPEYELLKELYNTEKYGKLLTGYMGRLSAIPLWSWDGWMADEERSGLVPFDLHIHDLDFMVYAFGNPTKISSRRSKRPDQDCFNVIYDYPGFYIVTEASWYAGRYPFQASFRFQFEKAVVEYKDGMFKVYGVDGTVQNLSVEAKNKITEINLPKSDAYANEIRYFTDCVKNDVFPDKVKPEELRKVIEILKSI